jgi:hypothetical protein
VSFLAATVPTLAPIWFLIASIQKLFGADQKSAGVIKKLFGLDRKSFGAIKKLLGPKKKFAAPIQELIAQHRKSVAPIKKELGAIQKFSGAIAGLAVNPRSLTARACAPLRALCRAPRSPRGSDGVVGGSLVRRRVPCAPTVPLSSSPVRGLCGMIAGNRRKSRVAHPLLQGGSP